MYSYELGKHHLNATTKIRKQTKDFHFGNGHFNCSVINATTKIARIFDKFNLSNQFRFAVITLMNDNIFVSVCCSWLPLSYIMSIQVFDLYFPVIVFRKTLTFHCFYKISSTSNKRRSLLTRPFTLKVHALTQPNFQAHYNCRKLI